MKKMMLRFAVVCSIALFLHGAALGQGGESKKQKALRFAGKAALVTAKTTAKAAFETARFTARHVVVPAFKHVVVPVAKAAPPLAWKSAKLTAKGIWNGTRALIKRDRDPADDSKRVDSTTKGSN